MADEEDAKSSSMIAERLALDSAYFNSLVSLVPIKYYLPDDDEEKCAKYHKNRGKKAPKQLIKEASKKAKKRRLDPEQPTSALDVQEGKFPRKSSDSENESEEEDEAAGFSVEKVPSGKLGDLKVRLHERIETLQKKRKSNKKHNERPKKKTKSQIKKEKKKHKDTTQRRTEEGEKNGGGGPKKQVLNDKGEVVFSKFDFMERGKNSSHGSKTKNYKKLLAKAEARKKKIEGLSSQDPAKAREFKEKISWKGALEKAEGLKQKDDPKLLKKSLKRREKQKEKSKKQWDARIQQQKKQKEEKQITRQKHLKERAQAKKGKGKKKHKPGF